MVLSVPSPIRAPGLTGRRTPKSLFLASAVAMARSIASTQAAGDRHPEEGSHRHRHSWLPMAWCPRSLVRDARSETPRLHPFTDGNGRTTRLLADLVFVAAQDPSEWQDD